MMGWGAVHEWGVHVESLRNTGVILLLIRGGQLVA